MTVVFTAVISLKFWFGHHKQTNKSNVNKQYKQIYENDKPII